MWRIACGALVLGVVLLSVLGVALRSLARRLDAAAPPLLEMTDARGKYYPGLYASYLADPTGALTFAEVSDPAYAARFTPRPQRIQSFGLTVAPYWLRIPLRNSASTARWLLEIAPPYLDTVDIYLRLEDQVFHTHGGDLAPFTQRAILYRHLLVELPLPPQSEATLYVRAQNKDQLYVALMLWNPAPLAMERSRWSLWFGALCGMILIVAGYNGVLFVALRERVYLYFICYALAHILFYIAEAGLGYQYLWPNAVWWQNVAMLTLAVLTAIAHLLFTISFLHLRQYNPLLRRVLYVGVGTAAVVLLGWLLTEAPFFRQAAIVFSAPLALLFLGIGVYGWRRGIPSARYYLLIWGVYGLGVFVYALSLAGGIPVTPLTLNINMYTFVLMMLFFSLALADRVNLTRQEKVRAQARALELAQENERLVREQNIRLEREVASRTAALRQSEERFATVVNSMDTLIYVIDMETHVILFANQAMREHFGDVIGQVCWQALQVEQVGPCALCVERPLLDARGQLTPPYQWEARNTRSGIWYHVRSQTIQWTDGRNVRLQVANDVTTLKEAELQQQRLAVFEERERIGRDLHDDLGQMIGYVAVQTQAVEQSLDDAEPGLIREMLRRVIQAAQKAHADLRAYILGIRIQEAPPASDFGAALRAYCQDMLAHYGLRVQLSLPDTLRTVELLPQVEAQLLRVVQEALTNVRKHAGVQTARIIVTLHPDEVQALIADDGVGFAPDYHGDRQPPKSDATEDASPHFGLDIMRERIVAVGGAFEVRSTPGAGTQLIVRAPRRTAIADSAQPWQSWRVLLADDQALFLAGLRNLLQNRGVQVVGTARNGEEALAQARAAHPDLILMDVHMPVCDGLEATRRIHAEMPDIKIVMLTVEAEDDVLFAALKAGASGYLLKALQSGPFFELLAQVMRGEVTLSPEMASRALLEFARQHEPETVAAAPAAPGVMPQIGMLTRRQLEILDLVAQGLIYKEVGQRLYLSERTVRYHMGQILELLQLENRRAAVLYARQRGLGRVDS